jgi:hypothetical protein
MPEVKHYVVTQTREVRVWANNTVGAIQVAEVVFEKGPEIFTEMGLDIGVAGAPMGGVKETSFHAELER